MLTSPTLRIKPMAVLHKAAITCGILPTRTCERSSSYLGGTGEDEALGMATDPTGGAYIGATSSSRNFPLRSPLLTTPTPTVVARLATAE
jgi:hypothetical protein